MLKRKISCILAIAIVIGMLPLSVFASETESAVSESIPEETSCQHTEINTEYFPVMGEKTHTVREVCTCGETVAQTVLDCTDETGDGKCDICQQSLVSEEEPVKETEAETVPEPEYEAEPEAETETEPVTDTETEPAAEPETELEIRSGDVNGDGQISTEDAMCILKYVVGVVDVAKLTEDGNDAIADVNGDGVVTNADATMIMRYVAKLIDSFPAEE